MIYFSKNKSYLQKLELSVEAAENLKTKQC